MLSFLLPLIFSVISGAQADWEANFSAASSKNSFPKASGKFYSKIDQFRVDTNVPVELSIYAKTGSNQVQAAVHSFRMRLTSNLDKFSAQLPACLTQDFADCVKKFSLKKVREESCGDPTSPRTCEVLTSSGKGMKGIKSIEVRHWKGEKEPILAGSTVTKSDGDVITTTFTNISRKARDAAFYTVPSGYANAGTLEKFFGDFRGKSE